MLPNVPFNDLGRAARAQAPELARLMGVVVESGWFVHGPHHSAFEAAFAEYLAVDHVVGVASGTDALEIALRAVATPSRRAVVTVANAGGYTTTAAVSAGLDIRFCDIDAESLNMSEGSLRSVVDDRTAGVVVTHLFGRMANVSAIVDICSPLGIPVIEDCAQAHGARNNAGLAGTLADLATFSFYPTKNLGALGDGGAIATSSSVLHERIKSLRQYGWGAKYSVGQVGGRNSRLDELQAAILTYRLGSLDEGNERRRSIIRKYQAAAPVGLRVLPADGEDHSGHLAVVVTPSASALRSHLSAAGIATDIHYPIPDHQQVAWRDESISLPVTEGMIGKVLSLPCFPELADSEVDRVAEALAAFVVES